MQPLSYTRVIHGRIPSDEAGPRTLMDRSKHMAALRQKVAGGGASSARVQLAHEIRINQDERGELLREAGVIVP